MQEAIHWEISVSIFKNTVILKQLGLAIGIPFGLVSLNIVLISKGSRDTLYALGLIAALFILTWLLIMVVYRGKYEAEFVLDNKGVLCRTKAKQAKKPSNQLAYSHSGLTYRQAHSRRCGVIGTVTTRGFYPVEPRYKGKIQTSKPHYPNARRLDGPDRSVLHARQLCASGELCPSENRSDRCGEP